jgi:hypothetical protein
MINVASQFNFDEIHQYVIFAYSCKNSDETIPITDDQIRFLQWVFEALFIPVCLFSQWFTYKWGLKQSVSIASNLQLFGLILRSLINVNFNLLYVGQILIALAFPFLLNLPVKISAVWFKKNNRSLPSVIGYLSGLFGILLAGHLAITLFSHNEEINKMPHDVDLYSPCHSNNPKQLLFKKIEI